MDVAAQSLMQRCAHWESFRLIEFHCSFSSVSMIAQVALTAATRQHLGLRIFCCVNTCIHCAGAGPPVSIIKCIFLSCTTLLTSLVTLPKCYDVTALVFQDTSQTLCFAALFQTPDTFFSAAGSTVGWHVPFYSCWTVGQKGSCYFLQLSGGAYNGFIALVSYVRSSPRRGPGRVEKSSNKCVSVQAQEIKPKNESKSWKHPQHPHGDWDRVVLWV